MGRRKRCSACKKLSDTFNVETECKKCLCKHCVAHLIYRFIRHWFKLVEKGLNIEYVYMSLEFRDVKLLCGFCKKHHIIISMIDKVDLLKLLFHKMEKNVDDKTTCINLILKVLNS